MNFRDSLGAWGCGGDPLKGAHRDSEALVPSILPVIVAICQSLPLKVIQMQHHTIRCPNILVGIVVLCIGAIVWVGTEDWRFSRFPSTGPLAKYLPEGATALSYEQKSVGFQDFFVELQASGTREDYELFVENLLTALPNAKIGDEPVIFVNGAPHYRNNAITIEADHEISVELVWSSGTFRMFFAKT